MKSQRHISLLWKMLIWLMLHLALLAMVMFFLVKWQFRSGLDGLLRGPAGDRLRAAGELMSGQMRDRPVRQWSEVLDAYSKQYGVACDVWLPHGAWAAKRLPNVPKEVMDRLQDEHGGKAGAPRVNQPPGMRPNQPGMDPFGNPIEDPRPPGGPSPRPPLQQKLPPAQGPAFQPVRPVFLISENGGDHYWAAVHLPLSGWTAPDHVTWVIRADNIDGNGLFFNSRPWLIGAVGILAFSILFWLPFALGITRYVKKLKNATDRIADGRFDVAIDTDRSDELGSLGRAINSMSSRIDHLLKGQKRFLGDVAHELCSPLARIRTGLGILETRLPESEVHRLTDIEAEAAELAELIDGILAFSRSTAGMQQVKGTAVPLLPLLQEVVQHEAPQLSYICDCDPDVLVIAEPKLLQRAISNILRNIVRYAGDNAEVSISASRHDGNISLAIADNGPGVSGEDLDHLFEPFYRPDTARTRETGGVGLGLAIVKSCVEACGGSVKASHVLPHGFRVEINLPRVQR
jgi:two-component system sensor histidine kinase CpxA